MSKPKKLQQTFKNINDISTMMIYWTLIGILLLQQIKTTNAAKYKGDSCETKSQRGICKGWSDCPILKTLIDRGEYTSRDVVSCGFLVREELICCPVIRTETKIESTTSENIDRLTDIFVIPKNKERPAVRACRRFEKNYIPRLVNHVRGGIPADWGEFPFVVALGYSRIGNEGKPPYDIRCGGSLIDKKFVLTAAHCVAKKGDVPSIVRLGVVDFKDVEQMQYAVEIPIKKTFLPDDYRVNSFYNDIAVLELEHEVETNYYIFPVCLYTNETDPDPDIQLWVSGWGTYDAKSQTLSDILLKAPLFTSPLESCNVSFAANGFESKIAHGLQRTQLCAEDKSLKKDSCQGDSGGPLHMPIAAGSRKYRLVGIVSSGFGCASSTPGLYTRVAAYLDFIEPIVWPNGGD